MSDMEVLEVTEPGERFDRWYRVYKRADEAGRPHARYWLHDELAEQLASQFPARRLRSFLGVVDGADCCTGSIEFSDVDNLSSALISVHVLADVRRRGLGSTMIGELMTTARGIGRTVATAETSYPYEATATGKGCAGPEFLRAHGFAFGIGDVQSELEMPGQALPPGQPVGPGSGSGDYRLVSFVDAAPADFAAGLARLQGQVQVEAPVGGMALEAAASDVQSLREQEELLRRQDRWSVTTVAVSADGAAAGYTHIVVPRQEPEVAYQWGTLVAAEHRGHGLGLAMKEANLGMVRREVPQSRIVVTYNAEVNAHMVAINTRLGFRPVERLGEFQRVL